MQSEKHNELNPSPSRCPSRRPTQPSSAIGEVTHEELKEQASPASKDDNKIESHSRCHSQQSIDFVRKLLNWILILIPKLRITFFIQLACTTLGQTYRIHGMMINSASSH